MPTSVHVVEYEKHAFSHCIALHHNNQCTEKRENPLVNVVNLQTRILSTLRISQHSRLTLSVPFPTSHCLLQSNATVISNFSALKIRPIRMLFIDHLLLHFVNNYFSDFV